MNMTLTEQYDTFVIMINNKKKKNIIYYNLIKISGKSNKLEDIFVFGSPLHVLAVIPPSPCPQKHRGVVPVTEQLL